MTSKNHFDNARSSWRRVNRSNPCPMCLKPDWCAVSADGQLCRCQRIEQGAFRKATDKAGVVYYLHRLSGDAARPVVEMPPPGCGAAAQRPTPRRDTPFTTHYSAL